MEQHFAINALHTHAPARAASAAVGAAEWDEDEDADGLTDGRTDGPPDSETGGPIYTQPEPEKDPVLDQKSFWRKGHAVMT